MFVKICAGLEANMWICPVISVVCVWSNFSDVAAVAGYSITRRGHHFKERLIFPSKTVSSDGFSESDKTPQANNL